MKTILIVAALALSQSVAVAAADAETQADRPLPTLSAANAAAMRCSAAFALVSFDQAHGAEAAQKWPDLGTRGREYFVRTLARIMDEAGIDRDDAARMVQDEAQRLIEAKEVDAVMPSCLSLLEVSGL